MNFASLFLPLSHSGEAGGALLAAFALLLRLSGLRPGHGSCHPLHQPVRGAVPVRHLWRALLLSLHVALLAAV